MGESCADAWHSMGQGSCSVPFRSPAFCSLPPLQVHRRDCEVSSLVAQVAHLEAAAAGAARQRADAEAKQQQHARSLGRLKESLHWCASETDALKRQLADRDRQLAGLQREAHARGGRR